jgi:uncharacterized protein (TIGR00661 family)
MKYLFFVQNEGRGHMTQALTVAEELKEQGHELVGVIMNKNPERQIPSFFSEEIGAPIFFIRSPYFLINKDGLGIDFKKSIVFNILRLHSYIKSLKTIHLLYKKLKPDVIINFFEPLCGLYNIFFKNSRPCFSLGHQFFMEHPQFPKPKGFLKDQEYVVFYNHITSYGSKSLLALSFTEESDCLDKKIIVCPPLIRKEIRELQPESKDFILSYILNAGYFEEIKDWAEKNPNQKIEAFWDKKDAPETTEFGNNLLFHKLSGQKFIRLLKDCHTYISTGGFDSIAEAAYLQKNILMVPTKNHYEQLGNAHDAKRAGLAVFDNFFNIDLALENKKTRPEDPGRIYKEWVDKNYQKIIKIITATN